MLYCSQDGSGERNWRTTVLKEKETGALMILGERNWCSTDLRRRDLVFYCSQENETGALLFSRRRKLVHYCFQEKETGALLLMFSDEGKWCSTVLGIKVTGLYCTQDKGRGAIPSLLVNSAESRQLVLVKFGKHFGFCFQQKIIGFISFI